MLSLRQGSRNGILMARGAWVPGEPAAHLHHELLAVVAAVILQGGVIERQVLDAAKLWARSRRDRPQKLRSAGVQLEDVLLGLIHDRLHATCTRRPPSGTLLPEGWCATASIPSKWG